MFARCFPGSPILSGDDSVSGLTGTISRAIRPRALWRITFAGAVVASGVLVTAQAASASWVQQDTPAPAATGTWDFNTVSCTSPTVCMAVGNLSSGTGELLAESSSKAGWTIRSIPQPGSGSSLSGISCTSASACIAVGETPAGAGTVPLAERWNGASWHIQAIKKPAGATASLLSGVSCTSPTRCTAVGDYSKGPDTVPLAERWNGSSWRIQSAKRPSGLKSSELASVSCTSPTRCTAVGDGQKGARIEAVAELWNGSAWSVQKVPDLSGAAPSQLDGISCTSPAACTAVGPGIAERWDGKSWSLQKLAGTGGSSAELNAVSCTRAGPCYAVGGFFDEGILQSVVEFWNGRRWVVQNAPISTSYDSSAFGGVSCTTATNCTAVGSYHDPVDGERTLVEDFALRWQDQSPLPFSGVVATGLNAVSCASPQNCMAVGITETATAFESFSLTWDGGTWTSHTMPKPKVSSVGAVSCPAADACTAVGDILQQGILVPLAEDWNGFAWAIQSTPNRPGALRSFLVSVSCASRSACTAVGFAANHAGTQSTLAERWDGKNWKIQHTPDPAGKSLIQFNGVSCASAKACVAVGSFSSGMFAAAWNGKAWKLQSVPAPKGDRDGYLDAVSCTASDACTAVGSVVHGTRTLPLAERWNGKAWKAQRAATPAGATASGLTSVSCTSADECTASAFDASTALAERWNGKTWAVQDIAAPPGSQSANLGSIACNSPAACMAVGSFTDSSSTQEMLADQYS
jgi:hypothetical protein